MQLQDLIKIQKIFFVKVLPKLDDHTKFLGTANITVISISSIELVASQTPYSMRGLIIELLMEVFSHLVLLNIASTGHSVSKHQPDSLAVNFGIYYSG